MTQQHSRTPHLSSISQTEMVFTLVVKNTFWDVDEGDEVLGSSKRCSSIPRCWKPISPQNSLSGRSSLSRDTISTSASDGDDLSDGTRSDRQEREVSSYGSLPNSPCVQVEVPRSPLNPAAAEFTMPSEAYFLMPMAAPVLPMVPLLPLNPQASVFQPVTFQNGAHEVSTVLAAAKAALIANSNIKDVKVIEFPSTLSAIIEIVVPPKAMSGEMLSLVKAALLDAASKSDRTYVMGYSATPFKDIDADSFQATIGTMKSQVQQHQVCWDVYQKGFCKCKRNSSAWSKWYHPASNEVVDLRAVLVRSEAPAIETEE